MSNEPTHPMTFGERACGVAFNPGGDQMVHAIKTQYANIVDLLDELRCMTESREVQRMLSVAITEVQTSQMWAVKAITWKD